MTAYKIELFLHVAGVIVVFGLTFMYPFLQAAAERSGVGATKFTLGVIHRTEKFVVIPGAVLVFVVGGMLIGSDELPYKDEMPVWLIVSIIYFLAVFAVSLFVQGPNLKKAQAVLETSADHEPLPAAYEPLGKRMQMVGGIMGFSVIVIAFLMVYKPGQ